MYYDDETRRFNLLSGLAFGLVLGAGLALLGVPQERVPKRRRGGHGARLGKRVTGTLERARGRVAEGADERITAASSRLDRWMGR